MDIITSNTPAQTLEAGRRFARCLHAGSVIALVGELGAGKTLFTRGILEGLGGDPSEVCSPTFPVVHEYGSARWPVFHFDFYRLNSARELVQMGWDDYLQRDGMILVEWADKFSECLPPSARWIRFRFGENSERLIDCTL